MGSTMPILSGVSARALRMKGGAIWSAAVAAAALSRVRRVDLWSWLGVSMGFLLRSVLVRSVRRRVIGASTSRRAVSVGSVARHHVRTRSPGRRFPLARVLPPSLRRRHRYDACEDVRLQHCDD